MSDKMTADDNQRLAAIVGEHDGPACSRLIYAYWHDLDRARRTPPEASWLHLGMLCGIVAKLVHDGRKK